MSSKFTLILGSQSPRRKEILSYFKIPFRQLTPDFDEEAAPVLMDPALYATSLATEKARSLRGQGDWILGADTVVFKDGKYFSKPKDRQEARAFLQEFSGKWQIVVTGLALVHGDEVWVEHAETKVLFNSLSDREIEHYLDQNIWQDKAGGYTIVGHASLLVEKIDGCFYNVMGLPVNALKRLLSKVGVDLWSSC